MKKWDLYTSKEIRPSGWLKRQLELQAESLSGNLDKVWRDVRDSAWIGGNAEGWERVPYWLDGFIPLAYLLKDEDKIARAKKYIDAIIAGQREDGWICPCREEDIPTYDTWAVLLLTKVLTVYYDCSSDSRIPDILYRTMKNYYELLVKGKIHLFNWGKARWFEGFIALDMLNGIYGEAWIKDLGRILKEQGTNYEDFTEKWIRPLNKWTYETHIVNIGMMLKSEAVANRVLGGEYTDLAEKLHEILSKYNGTPVGLFTGDECLSGLSPIQGTELCAVVEQMYSYELLFAATGDKKWAERLEMLAFNALPATISDDMWAHQYDQQSNQIACQAFPGKSLFRTNGSEAHLFGLEPNYGCCTANFNQGWPKFALSAFMHSEGEVVSVVPVPSAVETEDFSVELETLYPFENKLVYKVNAQKPFTLRVRIPSFASGLTVDGIETENCGELVFELEAGEKEICIDFKAVPKFIERPHGLYSVKCGSLVYSLPIKYEKKMLEYERDGVERKFPYCDYEYIGKSEWRYGLTNCELKPVFHGVDAIPFSSEKPAVGIIAQVKRVNWEFEDGYETVCAKLPAFDGVVGEAEIVELYPYGCAKLRMTEMPLV
ncbi:MAG: glycoside hydrolase family 127 protein [Oscillospiraceae bacterium]|nr:glycoside hydrolase family 127 protein [Oscillospiraceae bacterium]